MLSCGEEWSQHQKVITLRKDRPLHRAVPEHFEYLCIEWGNDDVNNTIDEENNNSNNNSYGGIAHAVESAGSIDRMFCLDVIAGILEEDPMRMRSKTVKVIESEEKKYVDAMKKAWDPVDWTAYLQQLNDIP